MHEVFVGNVPLRTTHGDIEQLFAGIGTPSHIRINKRFAFVGLEDLVMAELAVEKLHGTEFLGEVLRVELGKVPSKNVQRNQHVKRLDHRHSQPRNGSRGREDRHSRYDSQPSLRDFRFSPRQSDFDRYRTPRSPRRYNQFYAAREPDYPEPHHFHRDAYNPPAFFYDSRNPLPRNYAYQSDFRDHSHLGDRYSGGGDGFCSNRGSSINNRAFRT